MYGRTTRSVAVGGPPPPKTLACDTFCEANFGGISRVRKPAKVLDGHCNRPLVEAREGEKTGKKLIGGAHPGI